MNELNRKSTEFKDKQKAGSVAFFQKGVHVQVLQRGQCQGLGPNKPATEA